MTLRVTAALAVLAMTAGGPALTEPVAEYPLQDTFDAITARGQTSGVTWGALAVSLTTGDTLFARNTDLPLPPASNMKLLTTAAGLHFLGAGFRFRTYVLATAPAVEGIVDGDLILFGTGDPALSDRFTRGRGDPLEQLADAVASRGIREISGDLVADGSFLNGPGRSLEWPIDDLDDWFSAPVGGLSYNENLVTLRTVPASIPGAPPVVEVLPPIGRELVVNEALTRPGRGRPDLIITRTDPDGPITIVGSISSAQQPIWKRMTVTEPARFAGEAFRALLEDRGVRLAGDVRAVIAPEQSPLRAGAAAFTPAGGGDFLHTVATYESPALLEYLEIVNRSSHNFFAESVFKTLGRVAVGEGTYDGGRRAIDQFLDDAVGGPSGQVLQRDGSGLSPQNQASAAAFVSLLTWLHRSGHADDFNTTLPVAGDRRGLGRMYRTEAAGNLRAKTGTIEGVSALSGFVSSANGEPIAFSIISNGIRSRGSAKRLEDQIGTALASWRNPRGS